MKTEYFIRDMKEQIKKHNHEIQTCHSLSRNQATPHVPILLTLHNHPEDSQTTPLKVPTNTTYQELVNLLHKLYRSPLTIDKINGKTFTNKYNSDILLAYSTISLKH